MISNDLKNRTLTNFSFRKEEQMEDRVSFIEGVTKYDPEINVVGKEVMDERVAVVFDQIAEILQKSLGPMGAHTIISQSPFYHVTKDGFTIMKNLRYNSEYGYVDQVIAGMISDICGRLNFAVGDGTTSAVVASNHMYQVFLSNNEELTQKFFLPRNIINRMKELTNDIIEDLSSNATDIKSLPVDEMCNAIRDVVYISSNADKEMTDIIVNLYKELEYPAINVVKSADGVTRGKVIDGFMFPAKLMDKLYVNNDNKTQEGTDYDILIFDHKVGLPAYNYILKPLSHMSKVRGRKLICLAPNYDEVALQGDIQNALNAEYRATRDISLVLMGYKATTSNDRARVTDLAMLCNTQVITKSMENELCANVEKILMNPDNNGVIADCDFPFNMDFRNIEGIKIVLPLDHVTVTYTEEEFGTMVMTDDSRTEEDIYLRVGFVGEVSLALDGESTFNKFHYDQIIYDRYLKDAEMQLELVTEKYKRLATFNFEIDEARKRLLGLKLKMGQIEVGATSEFSQEFLRDAMDDAVLAAQSAYSNGIILGGHISLLRSIRNLMKKSTNESDKFLLKCFFEAFCHVRFSVLGNGFDNKVISINNLLKEYRKEDKYKDAPSDTRIISDEFFNILQKYSGVEITTKDENSYAKMFTFIHCLLGELHIDNSDKYKDITLFDLIVEFEIYMGLVLNLDMNQSSTKPVIYFDDKVVNSLATDREILIASSDLVGLLTTGNQLVISRSNTARF